MTATKQASEQKTFTEKYHSLTEQDKIIFKSILEMTVLLLKNMQATERRTS